METYFLYHDFFAFVFYGCFGSSSIFNDNKKRKKIHLCLIELSRHYEATQVKNKHFFGSPGFNYFEFLRKSLKLSVIIEEKKSMYFPINFVEISFDRGNFLSN